jgi:long-subunit acyl-CoA synthetase (AMP-forming)
MDQGEVTPTMKIRRRKVTERYKDRLEALYAGHG